MSAPKSETVRGVPPGEYHGIFTDLKRAVESLSRQAVSRAVLMDSLATRTTELTDLIEAIDTSGGGTGGGTTTPVYSTPPAPTAVTATALYSYIMISFEGFTYPGHGYAEILRSLTDDLSAAVVVGQSRFGPYVDTVGSGSPPYFYWVRFVNVNTLPLTGVANSTLGTLAQTAVDTAKLVSNLTGPGLPFKVVPVETTLPDGSIVPAGFYASDGYIHNGFIVNAMIRNLAVDSAKIVSVSASKITAGSISVGEHIQSAGYVAGSAGWRINGNGVGEFSEAVVRGTIFASAGQIGGSTIGATYMRSTTYVLGSSGWNFNSDGTGQVGGMTLLNNALQSNNFVAGSAGWRLREDGSFEANTGTFRGAVSGSQFTTGAITSYAWPPAGPTFGTYLGPSGLLIGNGNNGAASKYFQVTADGNISAPGFSVTNGVLTITEANVIKTLNLAGNAVSAIGSGAGSNYAAANITVPAGVVARVTAISVKRYTAGGGPYSAYTHSLNLHGSAVAAQVPNGFYQDEDLFVYYSSHSTLTHYVQVTTGESPITVSASASFSAPFGNSTSVILIATWR